MQNNTNILIFLVLVSLNLCFSASSPMPMVRNMDQLIAKLGATATRNSECTTIFDKVCPIGCNGRIGAEALLLDQCGICGGDGSSCPSAADDDGSCGSTCIGLVVGIPLGILFLVILAAAIIFFSGVAARRRRNRRGLPQRNTNSQITTTANKHYSTTSIHRLRQQQQQQSSDPTYAHPKRSTVTMTSKKRTSKIRWTNGWGKGNKYY